MERLLTLVLLLRVYCNNPKEFVTLEFFLGDFLKTKYFVCMAFYTSNPRALLRRLPRTSSRGHFGREKDGGLWCCEVFEGFFFVFV